MKTVSEVKAALLDAKRALTLDMPDSEIPYNEIDSAHYWNAVAAIETAINNLTLARRTPSCRELVERLRALAETMRHVVTVASKVTP